MKNILYSLVIATMLVIFGISVNAQPSIQWQKCLGGTDNDYGASIQQTNDSGYIVAGYTNSNDGDVSGNHDTTGNTNDIWVVKLNSSGSIQWQKCLGGSNDDYPSSFLQTQDSGYIVAGHTFSNDGDVSGNHDTTGIYADIWIVKLNSSGSIQWQKCLGGSFDEMASSIQQTKDSGYIVAGWTSSNDGDVSGYHGGAAGDIWVVKLNSAGSIQWQKCLGGSQNDEADYIQQTTDGGYIITGFTYSDNGEVSGFHSGGVGGPDIWVVKLDSTGYIQWEKCLGGTDVDGGTYIQQTKDGGYFVGGGTYSNDGDVSGNHGISDDWLVKLDSSGSIQWQKCLGGTNYEDGCSIQQTNDNGYILSGPTNSNDGDVSGNNGGYDVWVVKLDSTSSIQWQKCLGGTNDDIGGSIQQTNDNGYIVAGYTNSNDGDVSGNHGNNDMWVVKLSPYYTGINELNETTNNISIYPNPATDNLTIDVSATLNIPATIEITNIEGQLIETLATTGNKTNIDVSSLAKGMYFIKVKTERGVVVKKFVKE